MASLREVSLLAANIGKTARKEINASLRTLDLNSSEANILLHMARHGQEMNQDQLAEQMDITKAAISRVADSLEKKAYILRHRDSADRRFYWLTLTEKAKGLLPQVEAVFVRIYDTALRGISPEEVETMMALLGRVAENLSRSGTHVG